VPEEGTREEMSKEQEGVRIPERAKYILSSQEIEIISLLSKREKECKKTYDIRLKEWVKTVVGDSEWDERWMHIILALREEDKLNCRELSKRTRIGRGALSKVLDTLEDKKKIIHGYRHGISTIYKLWPHYKK